MSRVEIFETLADDFGRPLTGGTVTVKRRFSGEEAIVWLDEESATQLSQPLITSRGRITGWVSPGSYVLEVTYRGTTIEQPYEAVSGQAGRVYSIEDFGAVSGTDCSDAWAAAAAALEDGDTLWLPNGVWQLMPWDGTGHQFGNVVIRGESRRGAIIEFLDPGVASPTQTKTFGPVSEILFERLTMRNIVGMHKQRLVRGPYGRSTCTRIEFRDCTFERLHTVATCWFNVYTDIVATDCLVDGQGIGRASGEDAAVCHGFLADGVGRLILTRVDFTGVGSDSTVKPYESHCIYISHHTQLLADSCRFEEMNRGHYVQFFSTLHASFTNPPNGADVIRSCYFGTYDPLGDDTPHSVIETARNKRTTYVDCVFETDVAFTTNYANVKGSVEFVTCWFKGTQEEPRSPKFLVGQAPEGVADWHFTECIFGTKRYAPSFHVFGPTDKVYGVGRDRPAFLSVPFPALCSQGSRPNSGTAYCFAFRVATARTLEKWFSVVHTIGSGLLEKCEAGVWVVKDDGRGDLLGRTADFTADMTGTVGFKEYDLVPEPGYSLAVVPDVLYVGGFILRSAGGTLPMFLRVPTITLTGSSTPPVEIPNLGAHPSGFGYGVTAPSGGDDGRLRELDVDFSTNTASVFLQGVR